MERAVIREDLIFELDKDFQRFLRLCLPFYVDPPRYAQYLQYFHEMPGVGMLINGRKYMGNTPTLIGGLKTKMRFGLAAMNNVLFHTFHLHGHRWVIPGPQGNTPAEIQNSAQVQAVSQFEDTRIFGPANSFSFTINQGTISGGDRSFMGPPLGGGAKGEWHMHCHVLQHMMGPGPTAGGMMGSLLVIQGGELALFLLPRGEPCPVEEAPPPTPGGVLVIISGFAFPDETIPAGGTVTFRNDDPDNHSIVWDTPGAPPNSPTIAPGGTWDVLMPTADTFNYHCGIHPGMLGTLTVTP